MEMWSECCKSKMILVVLMRLVRRDAVDYAIRHW